MNAFWLGRRRGGKKLAQEGCTYPGWMASTWAPTRTVQRRMVPPSPASLKGGGVVSKSSPVLYCYCFLSLGEPSNRDCPRGQSAGTKRPGSVSPRLCCGVNLYPRSCRLTDSVPWRSLTAMWYSGLSVDPLVQGKHPRFAC